MSGFPVVSNTRTKRPKKDMTPIFLIGGGLFAIALVVAVVLGLDELRGWRAKQRAQQELKALDKQLKAQDQEAAKALLKLEKTIRESE